MSDPVEDELHSSVPSALDVSAANAQSDAPVANADYLSSTDASRSPLFGDFSSLPPTPGGYNLFRATSHGSGSEVDDESFPPLDRLTLFDVLENLSLPQRLERLQQSFSAQTEKVRKQQERLRTQGVSAKEKVVEEWRRRIPTAEEQLDKYKRRMRKNVDRMNKRWSDAKTVTAMEKVAFIAGVLNIFLSGYFIGACPEYFHYWYTAQLMVFLPHRWYRYHKIGYHYFLADLCYFVNILLILSIWFFPGSKRLFISTFCLALGNNAVAIAMWRNSLVFHSIDKVVSLFIHIMPCATLHCIVHLVSPELQRDRFPAIHSIKFSPKGSPDHYTLGSMIIWSTVPYAVWQLGYHFLITVRRREKIAAGRPTSFTWLRKSWAKNPIGKFVLSLPESLQSPAFMCIQYMYALITLLPCPIWFWYRWASASFLMVVFTWATYNGATFYIDVFGRRMEKELESLRKEVAKWHNTPEGKTVLDSMPSAGDEPAIVAGSGTVHAQSENVDNIPLLDNKDQNQGAATTAVETAIRDEDAVRQR